MSYTNEEISSALFPHPALYPYLETRVSPCFYHLMIIPSVSHDQLIKIATVQQLLNDLSTCLVLDAKTALFIDNGIGEQSMPPTGGCLCADKLIPCFNVDECIEKDPTFMPRVEALRVFIKSREQKGFISGDPTKGGRQATADEQKELEGPNLEHEGVPNGLTLCPDCNEFRGACLEPGKTFEGQVITGHCRCENKNKCAGCLELLLSHKLNANSYNIKDGRLWHSPGFMAFRHVCQASAERTSGVNILYAKPAIDIGMRALSKVLH